MRTWTSNLCDLLHSPAPSRNGSTGHRGCRCWEQTTPPVALFTNMLLSVFAPFSQNGQRSTNEACPELYVSLAPSRPARGANLPLRHSAHAAGWERVAPRTCGANGPDLWRCGEKRSDGPPPSRSSGQSRQHRTITTHVSSYQTVVPFPAGQNWARE